jgi:Flp pilus assembly protein TadG
MNKTGANPSARERGSVAVMLVFTLVVMLGVIGISIDTARLYNRKVELQNLADAVALAAAKELNGSATGVGNAVSKAAAIAAEFRYEYSTATVPWNASAIAFGTTSSGPWQDAGSASGAPGGIAFVQVDTSQLDQAYGLVTTVFMSMFNWSSVQMDSRAVAGRSSINVAPLAVCAMSPLAAFGRTNPGPPSNVELVEYGFRRGVSYDLMQLNPDAATADNFVISPVEAPGASESSSHTAPAFVEPYVCSGMMGIPAVSGGQISVARPFPLSALYPALNSRFDQYAGSNCSPNSAPPDANVKAFAYGSINWMSAAPASQGAASLVSGAKLWTRADPSPAPSDNLGPMYGPLWAYAKAVPSSSFTAGVPEPAAGYTPFATSAWSILYKPGLPAASGYPGAGLTPYRAASGTNFEAPSVANRPGKRNRRVLNVALLQCPVAAGANAKATVLGIGKFFMMVPATSTSIFAEFAGVAQEGALGGPVELYKWKSTH